MTQPNTPDPAAGDDMLPGVAAQPQDPQSLESFGQPDDTAPGGTDATAQADAQLLAAESPTGAGWYDAAAYKLISLREPAVERRLIAALASKKPSERRLAARALGGMGSKLAIAPLLARLASGVESDENLVVELIMALGIIGDPSADEGVDKARRRTRLDRFAEARSELDQALALAPKSGQTLITLARLELAQQDPTMALSWLTRTVELSRQEVLGLRLRAIVYRQLGQDHAAKGDLDAAVALDPREPHLLADRGALLLAQGQTATAQADFDRAVELRGDEAEPLLERAVLFFGTLKQYALAIKDMDAALAKAQPAERVWFGLVREALQRQVDPAANHLSALVPLTQVPWHDELLRVARGEVVADVLLARVRDATDRRELRVAASLWPRASGRPPLAESPWRAAQRKPDPDDVACALLRTLPTPTD